ncbi:MAG: hypothetical protein VB120_01355 [Lachnospiraceae bacterium]|nr:hypothetical protein [Lachnospiraceae bacterium]
MFLKKIKSIMAVLFTFIIIFGQSSFALADDDDEGTTDGSPDISIVNGPVFDLTPGIQNKVEVELKNVSSYAAKSIVITTQLSDISNNPLSISYDNNSSKISVINPRAEKKICLLIDVDKTAVSGTYSATLSYTYFNTYGTKFESSDIVYFKIQNPNSSPNFSLTDFVMPGGMSAGSHSKVGATLQNNGPLDMYSVTATLSGLESDKISINGVNSASFANIKAGYSQAFSFDIYAAGDLKTGNYPLSFTISYKDNSGKDYTYEKQFFINVGGGGSDSANVEILKITEPSGNYDVNQSFKIGVDIKNTGTYKASKVTVKATPIADSGIIVPKSASMILINELAVGESKSFSFTLAPTSLSKSQNYPVEISVEYYDGDTQKTVSQYAGVNVSNTSEDADGKVSTPKIIISEYSCDPIIVMASQEFNLSMTFLNTHPSKDVRNIKMYLTLSEETSTDSTKTGNIFTPVDSSNTFYFDSIPSKGTVNKSLKLYVVPDAQPKTYTIKVNFEYEDMSGNQFTATELLGINVKQPTQIGTGDIYLPETIELGTPISTSFEVFNTGRVTLNNLMVKLEGEIDTQSKSMYLGNLDSGNSQYYDGTFYINTLGTVLVSIIISYDDPSGEHFEEKRDFEITAIEPAYNEEGMDPNMPYPDEGTNSGMSKKGLIAIGAVVLLAVGIVVAIIVIKKKKAAAEAKFLESEFDESDSTTNAKGTDINE